MNLRQVVEVLPGAAVRGPVDAEFGALVLDSRKVAPGDLFFALAGVNADGARFVSNAVSAGAIAVVTARGAYVPAGVTHIEVDEPRLALAMVACASQDDPSCAIDHVVAVTGTNGKTTTTYMVEAIGVAAGKRCGVIGTTGIRFAGEQRPSAFTTPEAPQLQALLQEMVESDVEFVAMEISSHALVQRRAWGLCASVVIFTNLTQDHLDYHGTMDAYLDAKLMLFDRRNGGLDEFCTAVINGDDPAAPRVLEAAKLGCLEGQITFGEGAANDLRIEVLEALPGGLRLAFDCERSGRVEFVLPMLGRFNAFNAAAAFGAALALKIDAATAVRGLETFAGVPGRLERVDGGRDFVVVVDYAHTPDALERALAACREHAIGRVLCVFGCGGDRDRGKRPLMGAIAARLADRAWVTNDNPRSEAPDAIAAEIVAGAPDAGLVTLLDRREAIAAALAAARAGDIVLVAGKGHESTQTIGADVLPFDDRAVARELLGTP